MGILDGKVAIVTGAAQGMGKAVAKRIAKAGAYVVLVDIQKEKIQNVVQQIKEQGYVNLFKSHCPDFNDGEQKRDFVYVMDAVEIVKFFLKNPDKTGIYNVGAGKARMFKDLVDSTFIAMGLKPNIKYINMPEEIRDRYQYFTEAKMDKIRTAGYTNFAHSLEDGIKDYVQNYLMKDFSHF